MRLFAILIFALVFAGPATAERLAITGGTIHTVGADGTIENGTVLIDGTTIRAVGAGLAVPDGYRVIDASGQIVTPGLMNSITTVGVREISLDEKGRDERLADAPISAAFDVAYGINPRATTVPTTRIEGVTRVGVAPVSTDTLFDGQGAVAHLGDAADIVVAARAFMVADMTDDGTKLAGGSRGGAWVYLKNALAEAADYDTNRARYMGGVHRDGLLSRIDLKALVPVVKGDTPLVLRLHQAADIRRAIALADERPNLRIVLYGAREGWMVADELAAAGLPVIANSMINLPSSFESLASTMQNVVRLDAAGVTVALAGDATGVIGGSHNARLVAQLAGVAVAHGMPWDAALAAVTVNPARILGIAAQYGSLEAGKDADVVIWDGDPFEVMSAPVAVIIRGTEVPLVSRQTKLRDRYLGLDPGDKPFAYKR